MIHLDAFSGIGGFALAAHWAGFETAAFCEIEPFAQAVLRKHWPETPIHDDIRTLTADVLRGWGIERVDLLTGGFPCQDISAAGKGEGISGSRSGLWFELFRLIAECKPTWVVIENSPMLRLRGADIVLEGLEGIGYACWPLVVGADDAGAPHLRKRTIIVGRLGRAAGFDQLLADSDRQRQLQPCGSFPVQRDRVVHCGCAVDNSEGERSRPGRLSERAETADSVSGIAGPADVGNAHVRRCDGNDGGRAGAQLADRYEELGNPSGRRVRCGGPPRNARQSPCADEAGMGDALRPISNLGRRASGERPRDAAPGAVAGPTESGMGGVFDGVPAGLDGSAWLGWPARLDEAQKPFEPPRTGNKIPNRTPRLKGLGNSVVPQVVYPILQVIADIESAMK